MQSTTEKNISKKDASKLIAQQQIAHKLLAGFYENILACFTRLADECGGYTFFRWGPFLTERTCQRLVNPFIRSIWEFLPLYASDFVYKLSDEPEEAQPGNCVLTFRLHCDEGFKSHNDPPVKLESQSGSIKVYIDRCVKPDTMSVSKRYDTYYWPDQFNDGMWHDTESLYMKTYYKRYLLEDFIREQDSIQKHLCELTSKKYKVQTK